MLTPLAAPFAASQAAAAGACRAVFVATGEYLRLLEQNRRLFDHGKGRRSEDNADKKPYGPLGADLLDHYGRRAHDVDVEHL